MTLVITVKFIKIANCALRRVAVWFRCAVFGNRRSALHPMDNGACNNLHLPAYAHECIRVCIRFGGLVPLWTSTMRKHEPRSLVKIIFFVFI